MKKRILGIGLALMLLTVSASAAVLTDAPGTPTQDRAVALDARWEDEARTAYDLRELPADHLTVNQAVDVYDFVYEQGNRPVRWYPEDTQKAIEAIISVDPDALYMTEFMRLHAAEIVPPADLEATMTLTIDYQPGQLTVVVLGDTSDPANLVWTPVESRVIANGQVEFDVPQALMAQLQGEDLLFSLLTVRQGARGTVEVETTEVPENLPSKQAGDTTRVVKTVTRDGQALPDDFKIAIVPETELIRREITMLGQFVTEQEQPALNWLPEEDQNRVRYLLGVDGEALIVSDYVPLITEDFRPTDGDAVGTLSFATPYSESQTIVTALGIPDKNADNADEIQNGKTQMKWSVQPAIVREGGVVDVVFDQLALIDMGTETGLLLMLSEPTAED
ncbi:MAG: hypothetical protein PUG91_10490 [Clostridiales bacterium]|nr:hypothetical protein [Clostridiales bacterium]